MPCDRPLAATLLDSGDNLCDQVRREAPMLRDDRLIQPPTMETGLTLSDPSRVREQPSTGTPGMPVFSEHRGGRAARSEQRKHGAAHASESLP